MALTSTWYFFPPTHGQSWKLRKVKTHGSIAPRKLKQKRNYKPTPTDDNGPCNYLGGNNQLFKCFALAWKLGWGYPVAYLGEDAVTIDKAAWAGMASSQPYIHPDGSLENLNAWQWFLCANRAALPTQGWGTSRIDPAMNNYPFCLAPTPTVTHASLKITSVTYYTNDDDDFLFVVDPDYSTNYELDPPPPVKYLCMAMDLPPSYPGKKYGYPAFTASGTQGTARIHGPSIPGTFQFQRFSAGCNFENWLPASVKCSFRYVDYYIFSGGSGDVWVGGTPGPLFLLTVNLTPGWRWID